MGKLDLETMQSMQAELQERYKGKWPAICPTIGREKLLWMIAETGEVADIIKKQGDEKIMEDADVRAHFVEELCDTLMYFNDVCRCYSVTPDELEAAYLEKHNKNLGRW